LNRTPVRYNIYANLGCSHKWEDNVEVDIKEKEWEGMNWIDLTLSRDQWRALVSMVMNHQVL
jgi:hypothetical protein